MKKNLLFALCLCVSIALLSLFALAAQISTADGMLTLMNTPSMWNGDYVLTADIDLSGLAQTPIGNAATAFTGSFDGGGHTIGGIGISGADDVGLFGVIGGGTVTVKNLTVSGTVSGTGDNVGGIIGRVYKTNITIENCTNLCTVNGGADFVGGIIGRLDLSSETAHISGCKNSGAISGNSYVGGIAGFSSNTNGATTIEQCLNTGTVTTIGGASAGIVGYWRDKSASSVNCCVQDCINTGAIVAGTSGYCAGIIAHGAGTNAAYTVTRCMNTGTITSKKASYVRPIVGRPSAAALSAGGISNCYYTSTDSYVADTTGGGEVYVAVPTLKTSFTGFDFDSTPVWSMGAAGPELAVFHTHTAATVVSTGGDLHTYYCTCGYAVATGAHDFVNGVCTVCGATEIACEHAHTHDVITRASTCTSTGLKNIVCDDCGSILQSGVALPVDPANHNGTLTMAYAGGAVTYTCNVCGAVAYTDSALRSIVYVSASGKELAGSVTAQIGTAENPFKSFTDAMQYAAYNTADVTVVILDTAEAPATYRTPAFTNTITVTGGTLITHTRFILNGPMAFAHLCFSDTGNPFIAAQEHKIVMGEGITVSGGGIYLVGGYENGSASSGSIPATGFSSDITVRSGVYRALIGANRNLGGAYAGAVRITLGKTNADDTLEIANTFVTASLNNEGGNGVYTTVVFDGNVDSIADFYPISSTDASGRFDADVVVRGALGGSINVLLRGANYGLNVYADARVAGADAFAAAIAGEGAAQPYSAYCKKVNGTHPDANGDNLCDECGAVVVCLHTHGAWVRISEADCTQGERRVWHCADCFETVWDTAETVGEPDSGNHISENFVWQYADGEYFFTCTACGATVRQSEAPTVYLAASGRDDADGRTAARAVATLAEAVGRIATAGGTVVVCGRYPLADTTLPAYASTVTFKGLEAIDSYYTGGFKLSGDARLSLGGDTGFDGLLFDGNATLTVECNWNDLTVGRVEARGGARTCIVLGRTGLTENDVAEESATLTITAGARIPDHAADTQTAQRFYDCIYLGDVFGANGVSVSGKTAVFEATDADIGTLYTMSTSAAYKNDPVLNCETTVNLYGRTTVDRGRTGDGNVGYASSTAALQMQTINFFDNARIGTDYRICNAENTVLYISGSTEGRTQPMDVGFAFCAFGSFATAMTPMQIELDYGTHSFAPALTTPLTFDAAADTQKVVSEERRGECVYTAGIVLAATPAESGVKRYACACGRSYTAAYAYTCAEATHLYLANADGSYVCSVCGENFETLADENLFAVTAAAVENGAATVTLSVTGSFAAALCRVTLPAAFTFAEATFPEDDGFIYSGSAADGVCTLTILSADGEDATADAEIRLHYTCENGVEASGHLVEVTLPELYTADLQAAKAATVCAYTTQSDCPHTHTRQILTLVPTCVSAGRKKVVCEDCQAVIAMDLTVPIDPANHADFARLSSSDGIICAGCGAAADAPDAPVLITATPGAAANGAVEVTVSVQATTPMIASRFVVTAPEGFTLVSAESLLDGTADFALVTQDDIALAYHAAVLSTSLTDGTPDAAVLKLRFETAETVENGNYVVSVSALETYDLEGHAVETASVCAQVTVEVVFGDMDGDGHVSILDALFLLRAFLDGESAPRGDLNGDGRIGVADVIRLLKMIAQ